MREHVHESAPIDPIEIVIDDREAIPELLEILRADPILSVRIERLNTGDYRVDRRVLIERKTLADFTASLIDGRLFNQAVRLRETPFQPLMIVEGSPAEEIQGPLSPTARLGAWLTLHR